MKRRSSKKIKKEIETIPYYKLVLIGANEIGKTQLLRRFNNEDFQIDYFPTFGVDFRLIKFYNDKGALLKELEIIDIAGENDKMHESIEGDLINSAHAFLCVFDISKESSVLDAIKIKNDYIKKLKDDGSQKLWYLIGTKKDKDVNGKQVPPKYREGFNSYFEISSYVSTKEEFTKILNKIIKDLSLKFRESKNINKDEGQEDEPIEEDFEEAHGNVFDEDCKIS